MRIKSFLIPQFLTFGKKTASFLRRTLSSLLLRSNIFKKSLCFHCQKKFFPLQAPFICQNNWAEKKCPSWTYTSKDLFKFLITKFFRSQCPSCFYASSCQICPHCRATLLPYYFSATLQTFYIASHQEQLIDTYITQLIQQAATHGFTDGTSFCAINHTYPAIRVEKNNRYFWVKLQKLILSPHKSFSSLPPNSTCCFLLDTSQPEPTLTALSEMILTVPNIHVSLVWPYLDNLIDFFPKTSLFLSENPDKQALQRESESIISAQLGSNLATCAKKSKSASFFCIQLGPFSAFCPQLDQPFLWALDKKIKRLSSIGFHT